VDSTNGALRQAQRPQFVRLKSMNSQLMESVENAILTRPRL